jgi:hypothetical protein
MSTTEWGMVGLGCVVIYIIGMLLIDYYYKRKIEFVNDLAERVKEGTNGKSK